MSDIERVAIAMRHRYAEMTNDLPLVPFEKSKAKDEWLECARVAIELMGATIESLTVERDRLRKALERIVAGGIFDYQMCAIARAALTKEDNT
jgi:hypothetical protein